DAEFRGLVSQSGFTGAALEDLSARAASGSPRLSARPLPPQRLRLPVLLTSGTTGTPKGARHGARPSSSGTGLLRVIPYEVGDRMLIPTPLFHAWGLAQLTLAATFGNTAILTERFDPERTMVLAKEQRATTLALVPVMIRRILDSAAEP
ncbi:MAG: AMP-binding protein, partial [Akkermansiaceae bacterium]|nr:AMP-binding protein [Akkermansiaceae bacterium]NIU78925.1 AMP-binding protein [Gammaproteobacteria bacterium]